MAIKRINTDEFAVGHVRGQKLLFSDWTKNIAGNTNDKRALGNTCSELFSDPLRGFGQYYDCPLP